jgi:transcription elongation factor GreA
MVPKHSTEENIESVKLGDAVTPYIISVPQDKKLKAQQEVWRFIRWCGEDRLLSSLTVPLVSTYSEQITSSPTELPEKLEPVKEFLAFAHKKGWTATKLSTHIKIIKRAARAGGSRKKLPERIVTLSSKGYDDLKAEIEELNSQRPKIVEEIQRARADKDFRENAPLDAAREQLAKLESRVKELDAMLKVATIIDDKMAGQDASTQFICIGYTVTVKDMSCGESLEYKLVDAREANPIKGRISVESPIGRALINRKKGDRVEVKAPAGTIPYSIEDVKQD